MDLTGYKNLKKISEGHERVIYTAMRESDDKPVVLKSLRSAHPPTDVIALMIHEFEMTKDLKLPGVIETYELIEEHNQYALVQEDMKGVSLSEFLKQTPMADLWLFLKLAVQMTQVLGELHQQHIIHKDIKPSNFILHPKTLRVKLTDFNFSSKLQREMQDVVPPERLEGTLAYMAPEQTGRMNMNIDYRADFYALGVTFYEMLTGTVPFSFKDPLELLHAHLANPAPDMRVVNVDIPEMLSKLVQKLMAKRPIDRYQSATGIEADLLRCQEELQETGIVNPFTLGQSDAFDHLNISQKLYGREQEAKTLLNSYKKVTEGAVSALMVCGYSGIGKTMLINEVHRPMVAHKGYFISGKFDQLQRNTPYTAITQAFNQLARQILAEPEKRFKAIKNSILEVMGNVAQVMINIAPDIELVIGAQPALESLGPQETQNRLMIFFQRFLRVIASSEHPLVIFIDDLQWIDSGSLKLFEDLLMDEKLSHVLLIGAYRDNEVDEQHPLQHFFKKMVTKKKILQRVTLGPLTTLHFTTMLMDSFKRDEKTIQPLAALIHKRTNGNPFFCKQVINTIYQKKLLYFDYEHKHWTWQLDAIKQLSITDNVVDLMLGKLSALPEDTQQLLQYASCMGSRFSIDTLILISNQSPGNIGQALWPAMQQELIATIHSGYKRVNALRHESLAALLSKEITYQFAHDRVQQAVYQSMALQARQQTHLAIARLMMEKEGETCRKEHLFEITDHFNQAHGLFTESEKLRVIELNYRAGIQARNSSAYKPMLNYLQLALDLMDSSWWENQYDLIFKVQRDYVSALLLLNKIEEAEELTKTLLKRAKTNLDKASLYRMQVMLYTIRSDRVSAFETTRIALELLGVKILAEPTSAQLFFKLTVVKWRMRRFDPQNLNQQFKTLSDPAIELAFDILSETFFLLYEKSTQAFTYATLAAVELLIIYGKARSAGIWVIGYALLILNLSRNIELAIKYSNSAEKLLKETPDNYYSGVVYTWIGHLLCHFRNPFKMSTTYVLQAIQDCRESGNFHMERIAACVYYFSMTCEAKSINHVIQAAEQAYKPAYLRGYKDLGALYELFFNLYKNLACGIDDRKKPLQTLSKIIAAYPSLLIETTGRRYLSIYYFFLEAYQECIDTHFIWYLHEEKTRFELSSYETKSTNALALAKMIPKVQGKIRQRYQKRFNQLVHDCKWAANACPENYLHHYLFVKGAQEQLKNNYIKALIHFNKGIDNAKKDNFYLWVAVGNELAAELFIQLNQERTAMEHIREAHYYYQRYGMMVKVHALEQHYPQSLTKAEELTGSQTLQVSTTTTTSAGLDFMSVIKASQTISGEIVLEKLFEKMLRIVMENAGAEKAFFLQKIKNDWVVTAKLDADQGQEQFTMLNVILKYFQDLPQTLIQFSLRTEQTVVLSNASEDNQYLQDPYILRMQPKSVLCLPVLHHDIVIGIIYLENNLTISAFTQDRVTVLTTLASQIAISLENAKHIHEMERVHRRTDRFVPKRFLKLISKENVEDIELGDSMEHEITVLFNDIRDFTSHIEKSKPEEAFGFVNRYWEFMAPVIRKHGGYIDQFQGDAVMAIFPTSSDDALKAGKEMLSSLSVFNQKQKLLGELEVNIGIGINTGRAMLGIIGEKERLGSAVISDVTNTAARVESLNKSYHTHFLLSEMAVNAMKQPGEFEFRKIDKVILKGKTEPTYLYEVIDWANSLQNIKFSDYLTQFNAAFDCYERGEFAKAKALLDNCKTHYPKDPIIKVLSDRCLEFIAKGTPSDWDGTLKLKHK